ncbi:hypothetical protein [Aquidulcibacter paucihalophilus]|uniref:hypothetical protein n=1 Tax=Aquidulcibacter paucihalophilus TaxID=1978549 RepID=UPI000A199CC2|nr:hypothetical protein [Aquidulcibacter paucihalophilus]
MNPNLMFFLEFLLFSGVFLVFAIWQVISLSPKRIAAEEAKKQAEAEKAAALKGSAGHPEG